MRRNKVSEQVYRTNRVQHKTWVNSAYPRKARKPVANLVHETKYVISYQSKHPVTCYFMLNASPLSPSRNTCTASQQHLPIPSIYISCPSSVSAPFSFPLCAYAPPDLLTFSELPCTLYLQACTCNIASSYVSTTSQHVVLARFVEQLTADREGLANGMAQCSAVQCDCC
jgi:hypothetical protein